jgi:hypothetical protein
MDTYALEKLTGWTPELSPPPSSPLYGVRALASNLTPPSQGGDSPSVFAALADDHGAAPVPGEF